MITLINFSVNQLDITKNVLSWEIAETNETLTNYVLDVYRSETIGSSGLSDFYLIASGVPALDYNYIDYSVSGNTYYGRNWFYKFKIFNIIDNTFDIQPEPAFYVNSTISDHDTLEILRRKQTVLAGKYISRIFYFLKRKSWGTHCSVCWDSTLMRSTDEQCQTCYGTGWEGGYFQPLPFSGISNSAPNYNQIMMFGEWKPSDEMLLLLNNPVLQPKDVIVDDEGKRWEVIQIRTLRKLGKLIEQQAQLGLISPDDVVYKILINS